MTAPGDYVILLVLLVAFVACAGYAAGRFHQRFRSRPDRAEAYRDGYASGTRSAFSMAVRAAGPAGTPASGTPARGTASPVPEQGPGPERGPAHGPGPVPDPVPVPPVEPAPAQRAAAHLAPRMAPAPRAGTPAFPVPPPHTGPGMPAPAAAGGITYSALPDPRRATSAGPGPALVPEQRSPEQHSLEQRNSEPGGPERPAPEPAARGGRHTVPDELVRAKTYRLPADRVARARVIPAEADGPPGDDS